jgi:YidC/Oxa1 family membrane protein insertase
VEQQRILVALVAALVIFVAYDRLVLSRYKRPQPANPSAAPVEGPTGTVPEKPPAPPSALAAAAGDADFVVVETDVLRAKITPVGARLADLELMAYRRTVARDSDPLDLVQPGSVLPGTLDLPPNASDAAVVYRPDRTQLTLHGSDEGEVVFVGDRDGHPIEKRYRFKADDYRFEVVASLTDAAEDSRVGLILTPLPSDRPSAAGQVAVALDPNRHLVEKQFKDVAKAPTTVDRARWAGFAAQYFLAAAIPQNDEGPALFSMSDGVPMVRVDSTLVGKRTQFAIYTGPKERDVLVRAGHDLDRALDFGMFWFVAIPLLVALRRLHTVTGNYGVAIILLTAFVKVVTAPLTRKTFRNMREMQKIQPQMAKLRERFKDDQTALQKEMMELYRRHRVNPFSGCLPMVLQIPIFIGLYNALSHAIELRHAPFMLWINDLSAPDRLMIGSVPVPVLTLLMGASMFLQQWLTPQQGDPTQQRMMMFMPLVFTFMFINFPAGLVLYWLVNNVLTIAQQYWMMRSPA